MEAKNKAKQRKQTGINKNRNKRVNFNQQFNSLNI